MPKQEIGDPQDTPTSEPTADEERLARLKNLAKLSTREKLLRIMNIIGDEHVGDEQLLRALIVLEDLDPEQDQ